jgi:hypothetical protein
MNPGRSCKRVSVQADIGHADVRPRSGGLSLDERADALANPGAVQARQPY